MFIIGTAGHIDHGKSSLVKALTSIDPDRLPEEKRRGMTIDLGFAWLPLSNGDVAGIIDVPGHKDLMKNVIAGLSGIDAVLIVIAADDGWMPQTEDHVRILDMLGIRKGIVVITKIDQITDQAWLDLVEEDIRQRLETSHLMDFPIIGVSAKEGINMERLKEHIEDMVSQADGPADIGKPRLYIDRVFTISGAGTVATGTLSAGSMTQGQQVVLFPGNIRSRIRGLESYKQKVAKGLPGSRVAVNLVGIEKGHLKRGDILFGREEDIKSSRMIDAKVRIEKLLPTPLKGQTDVLVYLGTREISARIRLFKKKMLEPGESTFVRLRFREPVATRIGDHFILRRPSPPATVGGGVVLDPLATKYKARDEDKVVAFLQARSTLDLVALIQTELAKNHYMPREELLVASAYSKEEIGECMESLALENKLVLTDGWVIDYAYQQEQLNRVDRILSKVHSDHPLERGMNSAELYRILDLPRDIFNHVIHVLSRLDRITQEGKYIALGTHKPSLSLEQESIVSRILDHFKKHPSNPPTTREIGNIFPGSGDIVRFMCDHNMLVELEEGILIESERYQQIKKEVIEVLDSRGKISIQDTRDLFGFSRKYILPLMKKLDRDRVTIQHGDERILAGKAMDKKAS